MRASAERLATGARNMRDGILQLRDALYAIIDENIAAKVPKLESFFPAKDNMRMNDYAQTAQVKKRAAIIIGVVFLFLASYMIALFVADNIDRESPVIGTLYSLGYLRAEFLRCYMVIPALLISLSAAVGLCGGFALTPSQTWETETLHSFPAVVYVYPAYLIVSGFAVPLAVGLSVNAWVLGRKLAQPPLSLLRRERREAAALDVGLGRMGFVNRFRARQLMREAKGVATMFFGLFVAMFILMFGLTIQSSVQNLVLHITDDVRFQYMYLLKYPMRDVPEGAEKSYMKQMSTHYYVTGKDFNVNFQGVQRESRYLAFEPPARASEILASESALSKFGWKVGGRVILTDDVAGKDYVFTITGTVPYSSGLFVFMDLDRMRALFEQKPGFYNCLLSWDPVQIDAGRLYSVTTEQDIQNLADIFAYLLRGLILLVLSISIALFAVVMLLLQKMGVDRARLSISLLKIFGFTDREVARLYLGGNRLAVALTLAVSVPVSKALVDVVFPYVIANVTTGFDFALTAGHYAVLVVATALLYVAVEALLRAQLRRVDTGEVLKTRE
jgi:putative ABC transport system permease protein